MLRFRLGSIPVEVHFSHVIVALIFASLFVRQSGEEAIGSGMYLAAMAIWVAIISVSVLVHELGHALVSKAFGYQPQIQLAWLGGNTRTGAPGPLPWARALAITAAGPAFGAALGLLGWGLGTAVGGQGLLGYALSGLGEVNFFWAVLNLIPVAPLDGSQIVNVLLVRLFGKPGFLAAQVLGLLAGGGIAFLAYRAGWLMVAVIFGMGAFDAFRLIAAYFRGEAPAGAAGPFATALAAAHLALSEGRVDEATRLAEEVLESDGAPPMMRSSAHHLLGWAALKSGEGRRALDHFAQVGRRPVENEALAMAFALVGDDQRAVALWELAARERADPRLSHEWAATLLRLGRDAEAARISGVELATAHRIAARVYFARGEFERSAEQCEKSLALRPTQQAAYDGACARARARQLDAALALLRRAAELGFRDAEHARGDEDLAALRGDPRFLSWLAELESAPAIM